MSGKIEFHALHFNMSLNTRASERTDLSLVDHELFSLSLIPIVVINFRPSKADPIQRETKETFPSEKSTYFNVRSLIK